MSHRLYVGNLPYSADNASLRELFAEHGTVVDVHVASDRETGRSRGFGFVSFATAEEAQAAIAAKNGHSVDGRPLVVNAARERGSGPPPRREGPPRPQSDGGRPPRAADAGPPPPRRAAPGHADPPPEEEERRVRRAPPKPRRKPTYERDRSSRPRPAEDDEPRGGAGNWRKWLDAEED